MDDDSITTPPKIPPWAAATVADLASVKDIEGPIADVKSIDSAVLRSAYSKAIKELDGREDATSQSAIRVFQTLDSLTGLYFNPEDPHEPFAPFFVMEGRRSATLEDFSGDVLEVIIQTAQKASHPVLKARLCDVAWLLDRSRHDLGRAAIAAYVESVDQLVAGRLKDRDENGPPLFGVVPKEYLDRALTLARFLKDKGPAAKHAGEIVQKKITIALDESNQYALIAAASTDLDYGISEPSEVGDLLKRFAEDDAKNADPIIRPEIWMCAARAYKLSRDEDAERACRIGAAEAFAMTADFFPHAMQKMHWLGEALAHYRNIPGIQDRKRELRNQLASISPEALDHFKAIEHEIDLNDSADQIDEFFSKIVKPLDLLLHFAVVAPISGMQELTKKAGASLDEFPLSAMFSKTHQDRDGRVIYRSSGDGLKDKIAEHEAITRGVNVTGLIEPARANISLRLLVTAELFERVFRQSAFVPLHLRYTLAVGFRRFFQRNYSEATYILAPMLEPILRHILELYGHDTSTFDETERTQEARSLSDLLGNMRGELNGILGEALVADIARVFHDQPGPTIRHSVAHGRLTDADPYGPDAVYACWLIYRLCCLPLIAGPTSTQ